MNQQHWLHLYQDFISVCTIVAFPISLTEMQPYILR